MAGSLTRQEAAKARKPENSTISKRTPESVDVNRTDKTQYSKGLESILASLGNQRLSTQWV